ncbi:hydrolase [Hyphomicrobium sp.]|uniref:hydrolase n=1 Tax=Hyphomicrobium sp. TaxID=82 RepID=UPI0025BB886F|nr:hydrolase [Hyphomicrobium sp.]MCC7250265.1 hydrolase [Hyphomicrobium sp.]
MDKRTQYPKRAHEIGALRMLGTTILRLAVVMAVIASGRVAAHATERHFDPGSGEAMPVGHGAFEVANVPRGPVTVYTYRPSSASSQSPIWVVMPGMRRDAHRHLAFDYYDTWRPLADRYGAILLVPEFTAEKWPGPWTYNMGNVMSQRLQPKPWMQTAFHVVEQAFRTAAASLGSTRRKFSMFGHGAGSQFIQRYVLHSGCRMIDRAVAANPGWYMLPDSEYQYPYGLRDAPIASRTLRAAFACDFTLLLGGSDVNYAGLRSDPDAIAQGRTRYERGHFYFERSRRVSARMGARFDWRLAEVPGVGHEADRMAPAGAAILAGQPLPGS